MTTEWLQLVRTDPRLPVERLPADWPAVRGQEVLLALRTQYEAPARRLADQAIEFIPLSPAATRRGGS
jgi:phenylacetic acid degradation operon negative regulatory protein